MLSHPRPSCLGLIEATWSAAASASLRFASEAFVPRPH
ncbi:MAG: hypothetical protein OJF58_001482 [Enhydrobacter sp.]|nr:MAG: hypothetical protein OJF58_001482 [Enhydrobacter sp.]